MKNITRTITIYTYCVDQVEYKEGKLVTKELEPLVTTEKLSKSAIEKNYKGKLDNEKCSIIVKETKEEEKVYSIPVEIFIRESEKLEKESQSVETEQNQTQETK